jgi:hypothetical protein
MSMTIGLSGRAALVVLGAAALASCSDPTHIDTQPIPSAELEDCPASAEWLPADGVTPPVDLFKPAPHPTTECPFYRGVWQSFLIALKPDADGQPALLTYPTIDSVFTRVNNPHGPSWSFLGDVKQAGERRTLIDQNGNTLYYGIHMNQAFADFIHQNGLETAYAIQNYSKNTPNLFFPAGLAEFKSAWQIVDPADPTASDPTFVTIQTTVPTLRQIEVTDPGSDPPTTHLVLQEDRSTPRQVTVRLLAIHVVYTLPGHPEFIWGSLEHTSVDISKGQTDTKAADGYRDVAPIVRPIVNPTLADPNNNHVTDPISDQDFMLYKHGTTGPQGNIPILENDLRLDQASQKFLNADNSPQQESIYRMFPASKSNDTDPDGAVTSLNHNVEALFAQANLPDTDKRPHYRLIGGQWMDKPISFGINMPIQNDKTSPYAQANGTPVLLDVDAGPDVPKTAIGPVNLDGTDPFSQAITMDGSDSPYSILAGEDRMSSTAMESFTQTAGAFNNCFTCHNTEAVTANGVPFPGNLEGVQLLSPGLLNVSHILSQFVLEECYDVPNPSLTPNGSGMTANCPPPPAP